MAIITSIQKHAYILVAIIAICILTFLFEVINPNLNALTSDNSVGTVNGKTLEYDEYKKMFDDREKELRATKGGQNPTEDELFGIKNQIWSNFVLENVVTKNLEKLGIGVSGAELVEITTGQYIDQQIKQIPAFTGANGQYDPILFKNFMKTISMDKEREKSWLEFESQLKANRKLTKFNAIIENGMYVPKWLGDYESKVYNTTADVNYVMVPVTPADIEKVKYDDAELETYFKENKMKFAPDVPAAKLSLIAFPLTPSIADSIEIMNKFTSKISEMSMAKNDTAFFKAYGDKGYDLNFYQENELASNPAASQIFAAPSGSIVGPYRTKDNVNAVKILNKKNISDSVLVQAITISFKDILQNQQAITARMKLVDSIFKMLDTLNMDYNAIAQQFSADRGQAAPMWITRAENTWNPEVFFFGGTRKYFKSPSQQDVRILKVVGFPGNKPAVQIGQLSQAYAPSTGTQNAIYTQASQFIAKCKTPADITKLGKNIPGSFTTTALLAQNSGNIEGLDGNSREAVRWAFDSKAGAISGMMQIGNNYVYCGHQGIRSRDQIEFADVREDIIEEYKKEKAFKLAGEKLSGNSLAEIATKNGTQVSTGIGIGVKNSILGTSPEPTVAVVATALAAGKISKPIKGNSGVFKVSPTKVNPAVSTPAEILQLKTQLNQMMQSSQGVVESMMNNAKIKDNRSNIF
jgi:peptidyl-prolyl cis-trans isomerase D